MSENKFVFGVLTTYERHGWPHPTILQFFADLPIRTGYAYRVVPIHNFMPAAPGRNQFAKNFKDAEVDWLVMIDNDMNIPQNLLDTVKDAPADAGVVVPTFYMWNQALKKLVLCWGMDVEGSTPRPRKLTEGFHELRSCGTGVIFIRPSVFNKIAYPYFTYLWDEHGSVIGTEDIQFCLRAREAGVKIYGNTAAKVGHYHSVDLGTMWDWAESVYVLDKQKGAGVESETKDTESPSVPLVADACPAGAT